jgi:hypothetical protein
MTTRAARACAGAAGRFAAAAGTLRRQVLALASGPAGARACGLSLLLLLLLLPPLLQVSALVLVLIQVSSLMQALLLLLAMQTNRPPKCRGAASGAQQLRATAEKLSPT